MRLNPVRTFLSNHYSIFHLSLSHIVGYHDVLVEQLKFAMGGWMFHYLPFFIIGRVLYLHHYYPALFFAVLTFGALYDQILQRLTIRNQRILTLALAMLILGTFIYFSPMCYGISGPSSEFSGRKWLNSWNL